MPSFASREPYSLMDGTHIFQVLYLSIVQNRFLVIHECNEKNPPATIYIAQDILRTQWTAAPIYANNMSKSLPNALKCVNREGGFYVRVKTMFSSFPKYHDS